MERKGVTTVAVTAEEVRSALPKSRAVTSEEEKALRMRYGAGEADVRSPLPRAEGGNEEVKDERLLVSLRARGRRTGSERHGARNFRFAAPNNS